MEFREFYEQKQFVEFVTNAFHNPVSHLTHRQKPWSAKKDEIIRLWQSLRPDLPIQIVPMADNNATPGEHNSFGEDGIRITGSWSFIAAVIGRLKEILSYENPQTKLRLVFRGIDSNRAANPNRQTYAFYVHLQRRAIGKPRRPKNTLGTHFNTGLS